MTYYAYQRVTPTRSNNLYTFTVPNINLHMQGTTASVAALRAAAHCVRSLLPPSCALKCLEQSDGHLITGSAMAVLDHIASSHPAVMLLLEACEGLQQTHGCGMSYLIELVAELSTAALSLHEQGFAMRAVLRSLRSAVRSAVAVLNGITLPLPTLPTCEPWQFSNLAAPSPPPSPPATALASDDDVAWFFDSAPETASSSNAARAPSAVGAPSTAGAPLDSTCGDGVLVSELKERGNEMLRLGRLIEAVTLYSAAIARAEEPRLGNMRGALLPTDSAGTDAVALATALATLLSNRSLAYARLSQADLALEDARRAVVLAPTYSKAHHRLGASLLLLGKEKEARGSLATAALLARRTAHTDGHEATPTPSHPPSPRPLQPPPPTPSEPLRAPPPPSTRSSTDLQVLGTALAHGAAREMRLAIECAVLLGPVPWPALSHAVRIHRLVGCAASRSAVGRGLLVPLTPQQRSAAVNLLVGRDDCVASRGPPPLPPSPLPPSSAVPPTPSPPQPMSEQPGAQHEEPSCCFERKGSPREHARLADGALDAAFETSDGGLPAFSIQVAILDADLPAQGAAREGEFAAAPVRWLHDGGGTDGGHTVGVHTDRVHSDGSNLCEDAAASLATALRAAGVALVLVRGAVDARVRACCEEQRVLMLQGVGPQTLYALCAAARCMPLRDARALRKLDSSQTVWLEGRLVQAGTLPPEDAPVVRRVGHTAGLEEALGDSYLLLRVDKRLCRYRAEKRHSPTAPTAALGLAGRGPTATVLACGHTNDLAAETERRVRSCLQRLRGALESGRVLPGAGASELACAVALEHEASLCLSSAPAHSGAADAAEGHGANKPTELHALAPLACLLEAEARRHLGHSLCELVAHVGESSGLARDEMDTRIAVGLARWRTQLDSAADTAEGAARRMVHGVPWRETGWCPLEDLMSSEGGSAAAAGSAANLSGRPRVVDELGSKVSALHASLDVLQQVLLSDVIIGSKHFLGSSSLSGPRGRAGDDL